MKDFREKININNELTPRKLIEILNNVPEEYKDKELTFMVNSLMPNMAEIYFDSKRNKNIPPWMRGNEDEYVYITLYKTKDSL